MPLLPLPLLLEERPRQGAAGAPTGSSGDKELIAAATVVAEVMAAAAVAATAAAEAVAEVAGADIPAVTAVAAVETAASDKELRGDVLLLAVHKFFSLQES